MPVKPLSRNSWGDASFHNGLTGGHKRKGAGTFGVDRSYKGRWPRRHSASTELTKVRGGRKSGAVSDGLRWLAASGAALNEMARFQKTAWLRRLWTERAKWRRFG